MEDYCESLKQFYYSLEDYDKETEFKFIIKNYLLSLLGISCDISLIKEIEINDDSKKSNIYYNDKDNKIIFKNDKNSKKGFYIPVDNQIFKDSYLKKIRVVFQEIQKVTYNNFKDGTIKNNYFSFAKILCEYDYAVQRGICQWIAGDHSEQLEHLLITLEKWSKKTYEGKKIPFAFVIDNKSKDGSFNYIDFLYEEYSATFTDGITSIIELDKNLKFLKYDSLTKGNIISETDITSSPYRFAQVIKKFTIEKLGIVLLTSGDLILIKDTKIELIKRDGSWINFNKDIFVSSVMSINKSYTLLNKKLLDAIFYTSLDVSFSHGGGLISIVKDRNDLVNPSEFDDIKSNEYYVPGKNNYGVINYIDDLQLKLKPYESLIKKYPILNNPKIKKRFNKREAIIALSGHNINNSNNINFIELDRKLRAEFVSMDGATILDKNGYVISFGAIIQNDSGSYGGGRGAAAKKLSKYGLAIKISTDGYIEVYIDGDIKYRMK